MPAAAAITNRLHLRLLPPLQAATFGALRVPGDGREQEEAEREREREREREGGRRVSTGHPSRPAAPPSESRPVPDPDSAAAVGCGGEEERRRGGWRRRRDGGSVRRCR